jgi:hypothetical protein
MKNEIFRAVDIPALKCNCFKASENITRLLPKLLSLYAGGAALGERFDFRQAGHGGIAGEGGQKCAMGPAELLAIN